MNEYVRKMLKKKKEAIVERATEMYRSALYDHEAHMLCLRPDGSLYEFEGSGTPIGAFNGDDIEVTRYKADYEDDFSDAVEYILDQWQLDLLENVKECAKSDMDFDDIETWQKLFPDRFELDADEEGLIDEAMEANESNDEIHIWKELFPDKFELDDEDQKIMDSTIDFKKGYIRDEDELIKELFPDECEEMGERDEEEIDNLKKELENSLEDELGDKIEKFLLSSGCWMNEADMIDERKTSLDEVKSIVSSKKIDSDSKTENSQSYSR